MIFFKKKTPEPEPKPKKTMHEIVYERVLTAEGWRRRMLKKTRKAK
jgi:hypothetical protein